MLIGYARVSTEDQDPGLQVAALEEAGCERIYIDHASGKNLQRPEWKLCKMDLRDGDTLIVWKLDRLARSVIDLNRVSQEFLREGIELVVLTQNIDTRTPSGRFLFNILAAVSEMERDLISERTKAGMAQRRAEGSKQGGLPAITPEIWKAARAIVHEHGFEISPYGLCNKVNKRLGTKLSKPTFFKWRERLFGESDDYPDDWAERFAQYKERNK